MKWTCPNCKVSLEIPNNSSYVKCPQCGVKLEFHVFKEGELKKNPFFLR